MQKAEPIERRAKERRGEERRGEERKGEERKGEERRGEERRERERERDREDSESVNDELSFQPTVAPSARGSGSTSCESTWLALKLRLRSSERQRQ